MSLTVKYKKSAIQFLTKMPKKDSEKLMDKISTYAEAPNISYKWVKPLIGSESVRIRHGDYRAICEKVKDELIFYVYSESSEK